MGKIIVLEDNTLFAEIVCRWLQREGWTTETVTNISRAKKTDGESRSGRHSVGRSSSARW